MSRTLPALDLHAHIAATIAPRELEALDAVVFAATRSLDEFAAVMNRKDQVTVWGLGCHPGLVDAQGTYDDRRFAKLLITAAFVGEVGLDGGSRVPMERQAEVFGSVLRQVKSQPRLVSVHSRKAPVRTLDLIEQSGVPAAILHWWRGSEADTRRAVELGCLFSVNRSMDVLTLKAAGVPLNRLLPETDHPAGNRRSEFRQPGWTLDVEQAVGVAYDLAADRVRNQFWRNLAGVVDVHRVTGLLPPVVQSMLQHAMPQQ